MNSKILWKAKKFQKNKSNLFKYEKFLFSKYNFKITQNYKNLLRWSIENPKKFWSSIWDFTGVKGVKSEKLEKSKIFYKNKDSLSVSYQIKNMTYLKDAHFIRDKDKLILYSPVQLKYSDQFNEINDVLQTHNAGTVELENGDTIQITENGKYYQPEGIRTYEENVAGIVDQDIASVNDPKNASRWHQLTEEYKNQKFMP